MPTLPLLPLLPHQQRVIKRIAEPGRTGLVVAHGVGSGKSLSSIGAYQRLKLPTNIIAPASLKNNYKQELTKWTGGIPSDVNIVSQQNLARNGWKDKSNSFLVNDEAQHARDHTSSLLSALKNSQAKKKLLLTATPVFNHPSDISPLINLAANQQLLPERKPDFEKEYVKQTEVRPSIFQRMLGLKPGLEPNLVNKPKLKGILGKYTDFYETGKEGYPDVKEETVKVPMAPRQQEIYKTLMNAAPFWTRYKVKSGLPPGRGEIDSMRAFLSGQRQISNSSSGFVKRQKDVESPKIDRAFQDFQNNLNKNPNWKELIYSNYINSGLDQYKRRFEENKIPYGEFSGQVSDKQRNQMLKDYNVGKLKALLVSSSGAEGLSTVGTRGVTISDPHFNSAKEQQIIGRAVRYKSHEGLPPSQRNVTVKRYFSAPRASFLDRILGNKEIGGSDEYIRNMAIRKEKLNNQLMDLMRQQDNRG